MSTLSAVGARLDWFPFHPGDFLTSRRVLAMDDATVGRYVKLLCHEWTGGALPKDMRALGALLGLSKRQMERAWPTLAPCFEETDAGYVNERLEATRKEQASRFQKRSKAGTNNVAKRYESSTNGSTNGSGLVEGSYSIEKEKEKREETPPVGPPEGDAPAAPDATPKSKVRRGTTIPAVIEITDTHRRLATESGVDLHAEMGAFRDYHTAHGTVLKDWSAGLCTWLRNAKRFNHDRVRQPSLLPPTSDDDFLATDEMEA